MSTAAVVLHTHGGTKLMCCAEDGSFHKTGVCAPLRAAMLRSGPQDTHAQGHLYIARLQGLLLQLGLLPPAHNIKHLRLFKPRHCVKQSELSNADKVHLVRNGQASICHTNTPPRLHTCKRATSSLSQHCFVIVTSSPGCRDSVWNAPSSIWGFSLVHRPLTLHSASPAYSTDTTATVIVTLTRSVLSSRLPTCSNSHPICQIGGCTAAAGGNCYAFRCNCGSLRLPVCASNCMATLLLSAYICSHGKGGDGSPPAPCGLCSLAHHHPP